MFLFVLSALANLPPTSTGQAPPVYVGHPCSIDGVPVCSLEPSGQHLACDLEPLTSKCELGGGPSVGDPGIAAYIVSYDDLNVSVWGSCPDENQTTTYFSCYVDSSALESVKLTGTAHRDVLSFRSDFGALTFLYSPQGISMSATAAGNQGNDKIFGSDQITLYQEYLYGDGGVDVIQGFAGNDRMWGGDDGDSMYGGNGSDQMHGEDGWDIMDGGPGVDYMYGGEGDDTMFGYGQTDFMYGGLGADTMSGGPGHDFMYGHEGIDTMHGDENNDLISGGTEDDFLYGDGGIDTLLGDPGDDHLYGGLGNDRLHGGSGFDRLHGQEDNDWLYGGLDSDYLYGEDGNDVLCENQASEVFPPQSNTAANNYFSGGPGTDIVNIYNSFTSVPGQIGGPPAVPYFHGDTNVQTCLGDAAYVDCSNIRTDMLASPHGPGDPSMGACTYLLNFGL